jgi:hypothetical protein
VEVRNEDLKLLSSYGYDLESIKRAVDEFLTVNSGKAAFHGYRGKVTVRLCDLPDAEGKVTNSGKRYPFAWATT